MRNTARIGVSITVQDDNRHELSAFLNRWVGVGRRRAYRQRLQGRNLSRSGDERRAPPLSGHLQDDADPQVTDRCVCCCFGRLPRDGYGQCLRDCSIDEVWNGEALAKARYYHETSHGIKCLLQTLQRLGSYEYEEEFGDGLLIIRSPEFTYYNRIDRLSAWKVPARRTQGPGRRSTSRRRRSYGQLRLCSAFGNEAPGSSVVA